MEPEHALAMALLPGMALREAALTEEEALAFIAGEALPREGEAGWTLATWEGLPLGWGKQAGGMLKTTCQGDKGAAAPVRGMGNDGVFTEGREDAVR